MTSRDKIYIKLPPSLFCGCMTVECTGAFTTLSFSVSDVLGLTAELFAYNDKFTTKWISNIRDSNTGCFHKLKQQGHICSICDLN